MREQLVDTVTYNAVDLENKIVLCKRQELICLHDIFMRTILHEIVI